MKMARILIQEVKVTNRIILLLFCFYESINFLDTVHFSVITAGKYRKLSTIKTIIFTISITPWNLFLCINGQIQFLLPVQTISIRNKVTLTRICVCVWEGETRLGLSRYEVFVITHRPLLEAYFQHHLYPPASHFSCEGNVYSFLHAT